MCALKMAYITSETGQSTGQVKRTNTLVYCYPEARNLFIYYSLPKSLLKQTLMRAFLPN